MKQRQIVRLCRVTLCALLVGVSVPATADITKNWESPVDKQVISGIQQFRGFAYSTTSSQPLLVKLLVTAPLAATFEVPWGSARGDVGQNPPQLNSGFGVTVNVGLLPAGSMVTITLEVRESGSSGACAAPTCMSETRTFFVAKPGGRTGDANTAFSFLNNLTVGEANVTLDGEEIIVAPVSAVDSENGGTRPSTVRLRWMQNSQSFGTVDAASGTSFAGVQAIFVKYNCAVAGSCHGGSNPQQGLNLEAGQSFKSLINKSSEDGSRLRVNPGNSTASYLYQKVIPGGNIAAGSARMPLGCSGSNCLSDADIATIKNYIDEGAPPPQ